LGKKKKQKRTMSSDIHPSRVTGRRHKTGKVSGRLMTQRGEKGDRKRKKGEIATSGGKAKTERLSKNHIS